MTTDHNNQFTKNNDLLVEVTQIISQLDNAMLSINENSSYANHMWIEAFNATLREELKGYKVYDCWCVTVGRVSTILPTPSNLLYIKRVNQPTPMTTDHNNLFIKNNELLTEISQFINCLNNKILSENINFQRTVGIDTLDDFNAQLIEEINEYKVYDCWGDFPSSLTQTHSPTKCQQLPHH